MRGPNKGFWGMTDKYFVKAPVGTTANLRMETSLVEPPEQGLTGHGAICLRFGSPSGQGKGFPDGATCEPIFRETVEEALSEWPPKLDSCWRKERLLTCAFWGGGDNVRQLRRDVRLQPDTLQKANSGMIVALKPYGGITEGPAMEQSSRGWAAGVASLLRARSGVPGPLHARVLL